MKPTKAYIIRISDPRSQKYAKMAAEYCEELGIPYEYFEGVEQKTGYQAWSQSGLDVKMLGIYKSEKTDKSICATVSHALLWK